MAAPLLHLAFYRFYGLADPRALARALRERCEALGVRGSVILAEEGINGMLAGPEAGARELQAWLRGQPGLGGLEFKESFAAEPPFGRLLVKVKREIIPMSEPGVRPAERTGLRLPASELKRWLDEGREVLLLDTRNEQEIGAGTFRGARSLGITRFRDFGPELARQLPALRPPGDERPIVMFCTGGIRCEKATALALERGIDQVYQLEGGILRYFEECGRAHYEGECFVFDERGAIDERLGRASPGPRFAGS